MKSLTASTTDARTSTAAALIRSAMDSSDPLQRTELLASAQRQLGLALRSAFTECDQAGLTWAAVGQAAGLPRETAFRQYASQGPIAVIRATHRQQSKETNMIDAVYAMETETGSWFGPHDALEPGQYTSAVLPFQPADKTNPFAGQLLRLRIGPRPAEEVSVHGTRVRLADGSECAARFTDELVGLMFDPTGQNYLRVAMTRAYYSVAGNKAVDPQLQHDVIAASDAMKLHVPVDTFVNAIMAVLAAADRPEACYDDGAAAALADLRRAKRDYDSWRQAA